MAQYMTIRTKSGFEHRHQLDADAKDMAAADAAEEFNNVFPLADLTHLKIDGHIYRPSEIEVVWFE